MTRSGLKHRHHLMSKLLRAAADASLRSLVAEVGPEETLTAHQRSSTPGPGYARAPHSNRHRWPPWHKGSQQHKKGILKTPSGFHRRRGISAANSSAWRRTPASATCWRRPVPQTVPSPTPEAALQPQPACLVVRLHQAGVHFIFPRRRHQAASGSSRQHHAREAALARTSKPAATIAEQNWALMATMQSIAFVSASSATMTSPTFGLTSSSKQEQSPGGGYLQPS